MRELQEFSDMEEAFGVVPLGEESGAGSSFQKESQ